MPAASHTMMRRRAPIYCNPWNGSNGCSGMATYNAHQWQSSDSRTTWENWRWTTRIFRKLARTAHEFAVYITSNASSLINYGERYRAGERISSCLAESTVNAVISERFAKRQQMQWTPRGAHLLLQTRTRTLDGTLRPLFERWYPGLTDESAVEPL